MIIVLLHLRKNEVEMNVWKNSDLIFYIRYTLSYVNVILIVCLLTFSEHHAARQLKCGIHRF